MTPAHQASSPRITLPTQRHQNRPLGQVTDNQQHQQRPPVFEQPRANYQQPPPQPQQHHTPINNDLIQNIVSNAAGNLSQANTTLMQLSRAPTTQMLQAHQVQPPPPQPQAALQPPQVPVLLQGIQPPLGLSSPHSQNLTDLLSHLSANSTMFTNFLSTQVSRFNEQYQQFPVHHYHQHLHSTHHHHHAQNNHANSQDASVTAAQHLRQPFRTPTLVNDALIHSLFLQQTLADSQNSAPAPGPIAPQQPINTPQQIITTTSRTQSTALPLAGHLPVVMTPAQQVTPAQITLPSQQQQPQPQIRPSEQASDNQQQQPQVFQQPRANYQPPPPPPSQQHPHHAPINNDPIQNLVSNTAGNPSQANTFMQLSRAPTSQVFQAHQGQPPPPQPQSALQPPPPPPQTAPQPSQVPVLLQGIQAPLGLGLPHSLNIAELLNNIVANPSLFANFITTHLSRIVEYQQFPVHYHQHLHSTHHHHHAQNNQANSQDASMPLDSLAMNESKPRGLSRAEIDSLTPYMHTNEKDARTCVICLSKFELKSKIRPLPCSHAFHAKCVDKWLRTNRTCPICRRDALKTMNGKIKRI